VLSEIALGFSKIALGALGGLQGGRRLVVWWYDEVEEVEDLLGGSDCFRFGFLLFSFRFFHGFDESYDTIHIQHSDVIREAEYTKLWVEPPELKTLTHRSLLID
jgi:hypothetical protein